MDYFGSSGEGDEVAEEDLFPSLSDLLEAWLTPQIMVDEEGTMVAAPAEERYGLYVDRLVLDLPVEAQALRDDQGLLQAHWSPPTQWLETTVMPVWHKMKVTLECDCDETRE